MWKSVTALLPNWPNLLLPQASTVPSASTQFMLTSKLVT